MSTSVPILPLSILLALPAAFLAAADGTRIRDVRVVAGVGHGSSEVDGRFSANGTSERYSGEGDIDDRFQVSLQGMSSLAPLGRRGGLLVGGELSWARGESRHPIGTISRYDVESETYAVVLHAGYAWTASDRFHVELTPFVGIGHTRDDLSLDGAIVVTGDGSSRISIYGARAGIFETFGRWQVGVEARHAVESWSNRTNLSGATASIDADGDARNEVTSIALSVGMRL